ncbi:MAG: hypothetical protein WC538_01700 [Thermoanaerobaculia bacterium]|jgi:hypothetical protein
MIRGQSAGSPTGGVSAAVAALALCLLYPVPAHAYLDAGTGSVILQALVAVIAGAALGIRVYWGKLKSLISRKSPGDDHSGPAA